MTDALTQSILATVAYFDQFAYPLTLFELWQNLIALSNYRPNKLPAGVQAGTIAQTTLHQVYTALRDKPELASVVMVQGFCCLRGREAIIASRLEHYTLAERKYRRAQAVIKFFRYTPFVKMIAVVNTLAYSNSRDQGDIDLFIVCQPKRLWLTRFFLILPLKFLNMRPTIENTKDKICLSFFITVENLNLAGIRLQPADIYLAYWVSQLIPVYDPADLAPKFYSANAWAKDLLPLNEPYILHPRRQVNDSWFSRAVKKIGEFIAGGFIGQALEASAHRLQLYILPAKLRPLANNDTRVVINNQMLKFHDNDRRAEYRERFETKLGSLLS